VDFKTTYCFVLRVLTEHFIEMFTLVHQKA